MQTLKPECVACGTNNPLDSSYCLECGVRLTHKETLAEGMELFLDDYDEQHETIMKAMDIDKSDNDNNGKPHYSQLNARDYPYPVIKDERGKFIPATQTQINNGKQAEKIKESLDFLRIEPNKPVLKDKKLDFKSMQIPDWELGNGNDKPKQVEETFKEGFDKLENDPWNIPIFSEKNAKIEFNETPEHMEFTPISPITKRDVQKGISSFSKIEKIILNISWLSIIISLGILIYL